MTRLECCARKVFHCLALLAVLHAWTASPAADQDRISEPGASLQIVCAPDRPFVHTGDSVTLRAWVTDTAGNPAMQSVQFAWSASTGTIAGGEVATWSVGRAAEGSGSVMKATAQVIARHEALGQAACELLVYVAKPIVAPPGPDQRSGRLSAREFLLTNHDEPNGYGLYSYLLFATPP